MLKHKGYTGHVEYDDEAGIFHGEVLDLRDVITFQGKSVEEVERSSANPLTTTWRFVKNGVKNPTNRSLGG